MFPQRETQIKSTLRFHLTSVRMPIMQTKTKLSSDASKLM